MHESTQDERTRELEVLAEAGRLLTSTLDLGELLDRLAGIARGHLGVDIVRIWLLDDGGESLCLRAQQGVTRRDVPAKHRIAAGESLVGWVLIHREPLVLMDAELDPRLTNHEWYRAEGLASVLCVPMMLDDTPMGVLACMSRTRRAFTAADVALARALTAPAVAAVRNAALHAETLERLGEIQAFQRVVSETLSAPTLETALRAVAREMRTLLRSDAAVCSLVNLQADRLRTVTADFTDPGSLSAALPGATAPSYDLVVSNPPYVRRGEIEGLMPEVRDHDPAVGDRRRRSLARLRVALRLRHPLVRHLLPDQPARLLVEAQHAPAVDRDVLRRLHVPEEPVAERRARVAADGRRHEQPVAPHDRARDREPRYLGLPEHALARCRVPLFRGGEAVRNARRRRPAEGRPVDARPCALGEGQGRGEARERRERRDDGTGDAGHGGASPFAEDIARRAYAKTRGRSNGD